MKKPILACILLFLPLIANAGLVFAAEHAEFEDGISVSVDEDNLEDRVDGRLQERREIAKSMGHLELQSPWKSSRGRWKPVKRVTTEIYEE